MEVGNSCNFLHEVVVKFQVELTIQRVLFSLSDTRIRKIQSRPASASDYPICSPPLSYLHYNCNGCIKMLWGDMVEVKQKC